jgi:signal-transduction protein with cAMP-binding, CBS, and nucleotidyltransferase domain
MLHRHISCLPVVEQGRLCGVLTTTDVMLSCQCMLHVLESSAQSPKTSGSSALTDSDLAPSESPGDASLAAST